MHAVAAQAGSTIKAIFFIWSSQFTDTDRLHVAARFDKVAEQFPYIFPIADCTNLFDGLDHIEADGGDVGQAEQPQQERLIEHYILDPIQFDLFEVPRQDAVAVTKTLVRQ